MPIMVQAEVPVKLQVRFQFSMLVFCILVSWLLHRVEGLPVGRTLTVNGVTLRSQLVAR